MQRVTLWTVSTVLKLVERMGELPSALTSTFALTFNISPAPASMLRLAVIPTAAWTFTQAQAQRALTITVRFTGPSCDGPPSYAKVEESVSCDAAADCSGLSGDDGILQGCSSELDYHADIDGLFVGSSYVLREVFDDDKCSEFRFAEVFRASGSCEQRGDQGDFVRALLDSNGSASVHYFQDELCTAESWSSAEDTDKETVDTHRCVASQRWHTSAGSSRALASISDDSGVNGTDTSTNIVTVVDPTSSSTLGATEGTSDRSSFALGVDDAAVSTTGDTSTDTSTAIADTATDTTSMGTGDTSTVSDDLTAISSRSGSSAAISSSTGDASSNGSTDLTTDTSASVATDSGVESSTSSSNGDDAGSSSNGSASSTKKVSKSTRSPRVTITTTAPALDTSTSASASAPTTDSSTTESVENSVVADSSASGSRTSTPVVAAAKSSVGTGAIVGLAMGALAVVILVIGSIVHRRRSGDDDVLSPLPNTACRRSSGPYWGQTSPVNPRRSHQRYSDQRYSEPRYTDSLTSRHASFQRASSGPNGLWNDDVITAKRIPKDKVHVEQLLSRGAFGEVYTGVYNHMRVAVKMLLPQMRGDIHQVNEFLTEAKLTATMEHPHIVTFIGVAWDSLSGVCVVLEYMDRGDLRSLLGNYEATHHPVGFDREKVTIALHVCHALAYMHSLAQPVIHRDLKSRNVLLNHAMEAKLTDFGVSRERLDRTMTAGVGTSLWMAPEVMMGEKYDDKADVFSFGVVLSELDMHALPYAKALAAASANNQVAAAVLLQRVALGTLRVEFSRVGSRSMADLGCACVSVDPRERPTAAQILYKLQTILNRELL